MDASIFQELFYGKVRLVSEATSRMALAWHFHGIGKTLVWHCHGTAIALSWRFHDNAHDLPWHCHGLAAWTTNKSDKEFILQAAWAMKR